MKQVSVSVIIRDITRKLKNVDFEDGDIIEWCAEVMKQIGVEPCMQKYEDHKIKVKNYKALLPCHVYRILNVKDSSGCIIKPVEEGCYLKNLPYSEGSIYLDYWGIPLDDKGYPMISDAARLACFWYCLQMLLMEDWLNGRKVQQYKEAEFNAERYVGDARGSFRDVNSGDYNNWYDFLYGFGRKRSLTDNF